jgi:amino acid adenylation domain-containing protein
MLKEKGVQAPRRDAIPRRAPTAGPPPLSFAQQRLWLLDRLEPGSAFYNIPVAVRLAGRLDPGALFAGLTAIVRRHEALRTTFGEVDGHPFQIIDPEPFFARLLVDLEGLPEALRTVEAARLASDEAARPFDLERGPLLRATLVRLDAEEHIALLTLHHIVSDGWSCGVLVRELAALYGKAQLPPLPIQYADFAEWQRARLSGDRLAEHLAAWRKALDGAPPTLDLPADRPRPPVLRHRGSRRLVIVPAELTARLRDLCRREDATLFMLLLAACGSVLGRLAGQSDLVIGTPIANRNREEIEGLIGFFVNTLALRVDLTGEPDVRTLLARARATAHAAYAHQDLPFERIVEEIAPERQAGRNPLFQVMLALQNTPVQNIEVPGLALIPLGAETGTAKFDLHLSLTESAGLLAGDLEYSTELFDASTIDRFAGHLVRWLEAAAKNPEARVSEVPLLSEPEKHQILVEWNDTGGGEGDEALLHELFEAQVERTPEAVALIVGEERWTYRELDAWAEAIADDLHGRGVGPEDRVGVNTPRNAEMIAGLLGVLKAGGVYVPLDPAYPEGRLEQIRRDAGVVMVLTENASPPAPLPSPTLPPPGKGRTLAKQHPIGSFIPHPFPLPAGAWVGDGRGAGGEGSLAYLIYTSGSTGEPKGVAIPHKSAVALVRWAWTVFPPEDLHRVLAATSIAFDLSVFEIFVPLSRGGAIVLADDALALPRLPAAEEVTLVNTVPSAMSELVRAGAVPRSVRTVNLAGEPLPRELVDALHALPGVRKVFNLYGPSEDTTYSTFALMEREDRRAPSIGRPISGTQAHVLDRAFQPVPIGVPGELCLGGAGLARGYLGRPAATAEWWVPDPFGNPGSRLYRTGDLVRRRPDGTIEFLGRIDHQVKVRGFRIELGEIEAALRSLPGVREACVLARGTGSDRLLAAYVAGEPSMDLRDALRERLPGHMVPSAFAILDALPLTPNGKIDRKALARIEPENNRLAETEAWVPPRGPVEEMLAAVWSEVLDRERIGADESFFELGGHSLLAMRALSRVRTALGVDLPLRALFEAPTVQALARRIEEVKRTGMDRGAPPLRPVPRDGPLPLSFAQERMWLMDRLVPGSPIYNVPDVLRLRGPLRLDVLQRCLQTMVDRHESLRTHFGLDADGRPVQVIDPELPVSLPLVDLSGLSEPLRLPEAERAAWTEVQRPFDLQRGPVIRTHVIRLAPDDHVTVLSRHHIVSDGWSMELFSWEMVALYQAFHDGRPSPLAPLPIQYADFAHWQREWLRGDALEPQLAYWRKRLAGAPPLFELPTDRLRPPIQTYPGDIRTLHLPGPSLRELRALSRREGTTLFMTLLAAFEAVLQRYTGRDDVVVGTPVANRHRAELETLIGFLANTLVLRTDLGGDPSFHEVLARVRETALGAYEHQDLPFERLVEELKPKRDLGYTPLFQVMFVQQASPWELPENQGALESLKVGGIRALSRFDLELYAIELRDGMDLALEYNTDLFDRTRMLRMLGHMQSVLDAALADPEQSLANLPLLTEPEKHQLLVEWIGTEAAAGERDVLLHELVWEQADKTPDAVALIDGEERWTYRELVERAEAIAEDLRAQGVGPEDRVGVGMRRGGGMVAGMLGVLRAGGVYVPLDPGYPAGRLERIRRDAGVVAVLTESTSPPAPLPSPDHPSPGEGRTLAQQHPMGSFIPNPSPLPAGAWVGDGRGAGGEGLAYLIYTSGSTGEPKGVAITHRSAVALVRWAWKVFPAEDLSGVLAATSIAFDLSVFEIFVPLSRGGTVILAENALELPRLPAAQSVTLINTVPSAMAELVRQGAVPDSVRTVNLAGEALSRELADRVHELPHVQRLLNLYGPSEDTTYSTFMEVPWGERRAPSIGRPISGTRAVVVDRGLRPVPIGIPGELCLGGAGLARGYLGRPAATAERWIPDPFSREAGARLYRTGDLARFRADGALEFLGRIDHQVKVRGFRVELGEIEAALRACPGVTEAAVGALGEGAERRLVAWVAGSDVEALAPAGLRSALRERLPEALVPSLFVPLPALPRTATGKLDRKALPAPEAGPVEGAHVAPRGPLEERIARLWEEVLGVEGVGANSDFFDLGGHSLLAAQVVSRLRDHLGVELPVRSLFETPTVADLARAVLTARGAAAAPLRPQPHRDNAPLTFAQERMWFLDRLEPGAAYHIPGVVRLRGALDPAALTAALAEIVRRHEPLRTAFPEVDGRPVQRVGPAGAELTLLDLQTSPGRLHQTLTEIVQLPFDLSQGPPSRMVLVRLAPEEHVVLVVIHHIAADGWSIGVFVRELAALYPAFREGRPSPLPELPIRYADFAVWQRGQAEALLTDGIAWWKERLGGDLPVLQLPVDRPRPPRPSYRGAQVETWLPAPLAARLRALGRGRAGHASLFMVLLAGFQALLYRWSGQTIVAVGTPVAGRDRTEVEGLIGLFVNTLVLRADVDGDVSFRSFLADVRSGVLAAYGHQDVPFERLVDAIQPRRSLGHTPLFQVMLILQNAPLPPLELPGLVLEPLDAESGAAQLDLTLSVVETPEGLLTGLLFTWRFAADLFEPPTILRLAAGLETLLEGAAANPDQPVAGLPILSEPERQAVLSEWNDTAAAWNGDAPVHTLVRQQAERTPDRIALVFEGETMTYGELAERSRRLAGHLRELGAGPEVPVGVRLERSLDLMAALYAVLEAGAAWLPLDPDQPEERFQAMIADSGTRIVLSKRSEGHPEGEERAGRIWAGERSALPDPSARPSLQDDSGTSGIKGEGLAYVLFTSGSTGRPKGAMNTHGALRNRLRWMQAAYPLTADDRVLQKTPIGFDVSVWELIWPLMVGARLVLARPGGHQDPGYLANLIESEGITTVHFVPSMLRVFLEGMEKGRCRSLQRVIVSGEALPLDLQERFFERIDAELHNLYGPTEAAIDVTAWACRPGDPRPVPIGRPIANTQIRILDARLRPVPIGVAGELCIGGIGLARGYAGRPDLTAERFVPDPCGRPGARLYRTGDLARWRPGGELEYLGRLDHQVKIRGVRIEPGEIEEALARHPDVAQAVVAAREDGGEKRLAAWVVPRPGVDLTPPVLRAFLQERLPAAMVPTSWAVLADLPRTASGKVDRRALPSPEGSVEMGMVAPRSPLEQLVAEAWSNVLGVEGIGAHDDFFALGGHSLLAAQLVSRLRDALGVEVSVRAIFEAPTVAEQAKILTPDPSPIALPSPGRGAPPPKDKEKTEEAVLSFAQERMWLLDLLVAPGTYHIPAAVRLRGRLRADVLEAALREIVRRHATLRTGFPVVDGQPVQRIVPELDLRIERIDLREVGETEVRRIAAEHAAAPFDLEKPPLLRAALLRLGDEDHVLLFVMHHIISDGWSTGVLVRELSILYPAFAAGRPSPLPELPVQYADWARWQRERLGETLDAGIAWWRESLGGAPPVLELPADHARPGAPSFRGGEIHELLPAGVRALTRERRSSLFMVLLAAFQALLHRLSGQEAIVVGTPVAGRDRTEIEGLIGLFVNTLALRADLDGAIGFDRHLAAVRERVLGAFAHQDVPFERLVEAVQPRRDLGHTPLFQVMFVLQNAPLPPLELPGLRLEPVDGGSTSAPFDLTLGVVETKTGLATSWVYARDLFDEPTVRRWAGAFRVLLESIVENPGRSMGDLPLLSEPERHGLLVELNATASAFPQDTTLPALFSEQARRRPDAVAIVDGDRQMTYRELDQKSDELADRLRELGVGPEVPVGLVGERSAEMVAWMLAIGKVGGVYLPLDPAHPEERRRLLMEDAGASTLVLPGHPEARDELKDLGGRTFPPPRSFRLGTRPQDDVLGDAPAYIVYTSGSTGRPKGVVVPHRAVARLVFGSHYADLGPDDRVAQAATLAFDAATFEVWGALLRGARLVILPREVTLAPRLLAEAIRREGITALFLTTALFHQIAREQPDAFAPIRHLLFGGEAVDPRWPREVLRSGPPERLLHVYGPTESTTFATWHRIEQVPDGARTIPIGLPIGNTTALVLDERLGLTPLGVEGELYLGGEGLARGYLGRPDLTAERFVPSPWGTGARLYRTGDRVRRRPDGAVEFLGRFDHQVKIRGVRIEPAEVEAALIGLPGVVEAVVLVREDGPGERSLVAYVGTGDPDLSAATLRDQLREKLPEAMIPAAFVLLPSLPLTPNGKVDRAALASLAVPTEEGQTDSFRSPAEELLATLWADLLGTGLPGPAAGFFESGGHSLLAMRLVARVREAFGVELSLRAVFEEPTLRALTEKIQALLRGGTVAEAPIRPRAGDPPLSFAQQRLWFLDRLNPGSAAYNIPAALRIAGPLDIPSLAIALREVQRRHDALRTTFTEREGEPVATVHPEPLSELAVLDLHGLPPHVAEQELSAEAARPFDLEHGPLLRALLLIVEPARYALSLTLHHIAADGWSSGILIREISALYVASSLPPLPIQYGDFARWQRERLSGEALAAEIAHWRNRLAGVPPALELPADHPRPAEPSSRGAALEFSLPRDLSRGLRILARREAATPFLVLLTGFAALLARTAGQSDFCIGTPVAGRGRIETEGLVGLFVNTLALRTDLTDDPAVREALRRLRETALDAFAHQDLPFERLVEELAPERSLNRAPLFQVTFALQNLPVEEIRLPGLTLSPLPVESGAAKFDLSLAIVEDGDRFAGTLTWAADLFDRTTVQRLALHLEALLADIVRDPSRRLSALHSMPTAERHQLCVEWADPRNEPSPFRLHELFDRQVERTPDSIAVVFEDQTITYRELEAWSRRIADELRRDGLGSGDVVAIDMRRTPERIARMLGVWRVGAAWGVSSIPGEGSSADLAYLIYTSGSTGQPKGILAHHRGAATYLSWVIEHYAFGPADVALQLAPGGTFDASLRDTFAPLFSGARVVLVPDELAGDPEALLARTTEHGVTILPSIVPSLLRRLTEAAAGRSFPSLRLILASGETLRGPDRAAVREAFGNAIRLINQYGPSEATMTSTWHEVRREEEILVSLPVGRPAAAVRLRVLGQSLEEVPLGAVGEICLGGPGLAYGYLWQPDRTAEAFVPDPFVPGERLYRTGDRGRLRSDGTLELLGRLDHQVKIRGLRVEPGEIEVALRTHPAVRDAVVGARPGPDGELHLIAWVLGEGGAESLRSHLAERLPASLIPSAFVFLDAIPLTPHGKVDRRRLPDPGRERGLARAYVPPQNETERELARLWEEVLGIQPVGITDSFFDLGGHSLAAVRLVAHIRRALGRDVPLSALFRGATIETLAAALRETNRQDGPALFCIHGAGGSILPFADLARELGDGIPLHALEARGLAGDEPLQWRIDEMAETYLAAVRKAQPHGPYRLLGYSMGGKIAHEMARRLESAGETVELLALLDIPALPSDADREAPDEPGLPEITRAHREASRSWTPGVFGGRALVIAAEQGNGQWSDDPSLGWGAFVADVEAVQVPGGHYDLLSPPSVGAVADLLRRR